MPLFKCASCDCMDNTALTNWAYRVGIRKLPALCSACDPDIGKWHDEFSQVPWNEKTHGPHDIERMRGRKRTAPPEPET